MHGLYSKMREVAREARSGTNQQRNKARIADEIADAILDDLGSGAGQTEVEYDAYLAQIFDLEIDAIAAESDEAKIWFHAMLFTLMAYEIENGIPDGVCVIYEGKFEPIQSRPSLMRPIVDLMEQWGAEDALLPEK